MFREILRPGSILEILLFSVAFYLILNFVRGTRAASVLKGLLFFIVVAFIVAMFVADVLELHRLNMILNGLLAFSSIALIVIFAPEMRHALSRISQTPFLTFVPHLTPERVAEQIVTAALRLSKSRTGMIVAIQREVGLGEYIDRGVPLNAHVSSTLLESLFHPGGPLHDGAVIVRDGQVAAAGCILPLSESPDISKGLGTRHRAAVGLTEQTDAVVIVVSEETGSVSVATNGSIRTSLTRQELELALRDLYLKTGIGSERSPS